MKEFTRARNAPDRAAQALYGAASRLDRVHAFAAVLAAGLTAHLALEPTYDWLLLLVAGLAAVAADTVVRNHPAAQFQRLDDTVLYLFVPVLFTLGMGLFFERVAGGPAALLTGLLSVFPYWFILRAEFESVDRESPDYHFNRLLLNVATYVVAFLFFAAIYDFELGVTSSALAAGIVSVLLAVEVLREEELPPERTMMYAAATGLILAEAAWATHFLPLEGSAPAVFLLLAFYVTTGLVHNYVAGRLTPRTAGEFALVAAAALAAAAVSQAYV